MSCSLVGILEVFTHTLSLNHPLDVSSVDGFYADPNLIAMAPFITFLAALAAITAPLVQAVPVGQTVANPPPPQQQNCAAALILAQGISENIEDQKNEKAALAQVSQVLQKTPVDANAFAAAKANLLTFVNNGNSLSTSARPRWWCLKQDAQNVPHSSSETQW